MARCGCLFGPREPVDDPPQGSVLVLAPSLNPTCMLRTCLMPEIGSNRLLLLNRTKLILHCTFSSTAAFCTSARLAGTLKQMYDHVRDVSTDVSSCQDA